MFVKKKILIGIAVAVLVAAGVVAAIIIRRPSAKVQETEIQAGPGEKIVYATIDEINGNDIEVSIMNEDMVNRIKAMSGAGKQNGEETDRGGFGGGMPDMGGGAPEGFGGSFEGGMPEGFPGGDFPGEMPEGFDGEMPDMEGMPEGGMMPPFGQEKEEKKASYQIPVGTDVITTLGATTTFSHLEEGDTIAILMEENSEAILKIWMIM